mmetsp:Transcript_9082/g.18385  ORF Transcript_9082/g.18385 Transcript_9082/m.18385 type:complete len:103 (-) Transcript_9082:1564-1872(-)
MVEAGWKRERLTHSYAALRMIMTEMGVVSTGRVYKAIQPSTISFSGDGGLPVTVSQPPRGVTQSGKSLLVRRKELLVHQRLGEILGSLGTVSRLQLCLEQNW